MAKKLRKIAQNKKNLVRQGLLLAVIFSLLLAIALGWFASNQQLSAGGVQLTPAANDVTAKLYRLLDGGSVNNELDWIEEKSLIIDEYVPTEIKTYKIVLTNASADLDHTCAVQFANFSVTKERDGTPVANSAVKLEEQILLKDVSLNTPSTAFWVPSTLPLPISELFETDTRNMYLAKDVLVQADSDPDSGTENKAEILFSFQLAPLANNYYQNKLMTVDSILVTTV